MSLKKRKTSKKSFGFSKFLLNLLILHYSTFNRNQKETDPVNRRLIQNLKIKDHNILSLQQRCDWSVGLT